MVSGERSRVTTYLISDHARLHTLLTRATASAVFDDEAFAAFRAGLLRHIAIEEKLLFPAARRARRGEPLSRAYQLRVEHAALTSLLVPTPDAALCKEILAVLGPHNNKEEGPDGVYAECEQLLGDAKSEELAQEAVSYRQVNVAPYFDGEKVCRTAKAALAAASRIKPLRKGTLT